MPKTWQVVLDSKVLQGWSITEEMAHVIALMEDLGHGLPVLPNSIEAIGSEMLDGTKGILAITTEGQQPD